MLERRRESAAALQELAEKPAALAASIAALAPRASEGPLDGDALRTVERPGVRCVLLRDATVRGDVFSRADGTKRSSAAIARALDSKESEVRLSRPEAAEIGLPARTAVAALRTFEWHSHPYDVAVVTSAASERDREQRAQWRLVLSILLGSGLVVGFGVAALRRQRKELDLARELEVAAVARERDEQLARGAKLATLAALATGIAHDVSTPLGVIVGRADAIASNDGGDPKTKRAAAIILEQSERIAGTVRGFLGLARGTTPPLVRAAPDEIATRAATLTEHRFEQAGVHFTIDAARDLPRVACDPNLFEHVLVNLLLNACEAAGPGGNVELSVTSKDQRVSFAVTDDGPGIDDDAARRAVEPFFTTKPKGTGLGLAIANEIAQHHNGTLAIARRDGARGTIAVVSLPEARDA